MVVQINPSKVPIWISENTLQLGIDEQSQKLEHLTNSQERLIHLLFEGVANDQVEVVANSVGLDSLEGFQLIELLRPSLVGGEKSSGSKNSNDARFAELIRIGFQTDQSPAEVLSKRSEYRIVVSKLDRTGLTLIRALSELGFQNFETEDYSLITSEDHGELGYPKSLSGVSKLIAINSLLETKESEVSVLPMKKSKRNRQSITILSASHQLTPTDYQKLQSPYLAIEYRIEEIAVSNLIESGATPCLGCRDLWSADTKPNWASTAIQLAGRRDQLDDGANLLLASAVACRNIAAFTDFDSRGNNWNLNLKTKRIAEPEPQFHPECRCQELARNQI